MAFLQYLTGCFSLFFLEGYHFFSSPVVVSLYLVFMTWEPSVLSKRVTSLASTSSWSYWRYSNFFLLFSSSASLLFLDSSFVLAFTTFLTFWAAHLIWQAFATSSKWTWSYCSSLCLLCIFHCCSLSILALFWKILEEVGEDIVIQKKR